MKKLVIIPTYNERENIARLTSKIVFAVSIALTVILGVALLW